jgi:hypothetical protein
MTCAATSAAYLIAGARGMLGTSLQRVSTAALARRMSEMDPTLMGQR